MSKKRENLSLAALPSAQKAIVQELYIPIALKSKIEKQEPPKSEEPEQRNP